MNPPDLLSLADDLVGRASGRPRLAYLHRATSSIYYALFHTLARCCADTLIGGSSADRSKPAWVQTYRALQHRDAKDACRRGDISLFPREIQDFANLFVTMQGMRHQADYAPNERAYKSVVAADIVLAESTINGFKSATLKDRRAFSAFVLFKKRT